jgi:disulfide bond formation protein DsbB
MSSKLVRSALFGVAIFCGALLVYAYLLQYGPEKQQPCPLCILQRYAYFVVAIIAGVGSIFPKRGLIWLAAASSASGGMLALWQVLKGSSMTSCQRDPVGIFVNSLPMADWWPEYLFATGGCADKFFTLGLPVPVWSLACFSILAALLVYIAIKKQ